MPYEQPMSPEMQAIVEADTAARGASGLNPSYRQPAQAMPMGGGIPPELMEMQRQIQQNYMASQQPKKPSTLATIALGLFGGPGLAIAYNQSTKRNQQAQQLKQQQAYAQMMNSLANLQQQSLPYYERGGEQSLAAGILGQLGMQPQAQLVRETPYARSDTYKDLMQAYSRNPLAKGFMSQQTDLTNQLNTNEASMLDALGRHPLPQGLGAPTAPTQQPQQPIDREAMGIFAPAPRPQKAAKLFDKEFPVSSPYGAARKGYVHQGIDYAVPVGTKAKVPFDAKFLRTYTDKKGGGNVSEFETLGIDGKKYTMQYLHGDNQGSLGLKAGQIIPQGGLAFITGNTGRSSGPHLDFRIKGPDGKRISPDKFLTMQMANMALKGVAGLDQSTPPLQLTDGVQQVANMPTQQMQPMPQPQQLAYNDMLGNTPIFDPSVLTAMIQQQGGLLQGRKTPTDIYGQVSQARGREMTGFKDMTEAQQMPARTAVQQQEAALKAADLAQKAEQFGRTAGQKDTELDIAQKRLALDAQSAGAGASPEVARQMETLEKGRQAILNNAATEGYIDSKTKQWTVPSNGTESILKAYQGRIKELADKQLSLISGSVKDAGAAKIIPRKSAFETIKASTGVEARL